MLAINTRTAFAIHTRARVRTARQCAKIYAGPVSKIGKTCLMAGLLHALPLPALKTPLMPDWRNGHMENKSMVNKYADDGEQDCLALGFRLT